MKGNEIGWGKQSLNVLRIISGALCLSAVLAPGLAWANGISITEPSLVSKDTTNDTWDIRFTASWDNAWCDTGAACNGDAQTQTGNWDAAWIFAKFSKWNSGTSTWGNWTHCTLSKTNSDHTAPAGSTIKTGCSPLADCGGSDTGMGVFIYHSAAGVYSAANANQTNFANVAVRWQYGTDGVADTDIVKVRIFGLEMVYIPSGTFFIGDGSASPQANFRFADGTAGQIKITTALSNAVNGSSTSNTSDDTYMLEGAGAPGNGAGIRIDGDGGIYDSAGVSTNVAFPTGYSAFYVMKSELSQGQYRDFLNTLTRTQQNTRTASQLASRYALSNTALVNFRSGLRAPAVIPAGVITFGCDLEGITAHNTTAGDGTFNESNDGEWVAVNYTSWMDAAAFTAWAGLRPFTELEFEKAARGPQYPVADEYAWGSTSITSPTGITNSGQMGEAASNAASNCNVVSSIVLGPIRSGAYAAAATTRAQAGASYYGVMDLTGNLVEMSVTVGNPNGRAFRGTHGSGTLSMNGNATNSDWPGYVTSEVTGATGSGLRGGSWYYAPGTPMLQVARVSDRGGAGGGITTRHRAYGFRAARTSPQ